MPRLRQIALNANNGAFVDVLATIPARQMSAMEDEAAATQGIQVKSLLDAFATTNAFSFASQPILIPDSERYPNNGPLIGFPAQGAAGAFNQSAATKLISARSNGAAGTTLRVVENE